MVESEHEETGLEGVDEGLGEAVEGEPDGEVDEDLVSRGGCVRQDGG